jgi:hypothetical protein
MNAGLVVGLALMGLCCLGLVGCGGFVNSARVSESALRELGGYQINRAEFQRRLQGLPSALKRGMPQEPVAFPMGFEEGLPVIRTAGPDAMPMDWLVDSGAARLVVGGAWAAKQKVQTLPAQQAQATLMGVVGNEQGLVGWLPAMSLGPWRIEGYPCLVRLAQERSWLEQSHHGILGFELPLRVCRYLTLDYPQRRVVFGFGESFVRPPPQRSSHCAFSVRGGVPVVILRSGKVSWESIVDTGSFNGIEINDAIAGRLGVVSLAKAVEGLTLVGLGGAIESESASLRTVTLPQLEALGGQYEAAEVDVTLGLPSLGSYFLKDYRVTFDMEQGQLWLEW